MLVKNQNPFGRTLDIQSFWYHSQIVLITFTNFLKLESKPPRRNLCYPFLHITINEGSKGKGFIVRDKPTEKEGGGVGAESVGI